MSKEAKKKFRFRFPLWAKTLAMLVLSVVAVSSAAITFFYTSIRSITRSHYIEHSSELAETLAIFLDIEEIKTVKNKVDEIYRSIPEEEKIENSYWGEPEWEEYLAKFEEITEMPEYISLLDDISLFHSKNDAKFTYIAYADLENDRLVYLVDDADLEERCLPGSFDNFTESDIAAKEHLENGFPPEITNMEEYGYLATVGMPIFDGEKSKENIVAFSIVDLSMDEIVAKEEKSIRTLIIILVSLSLGTVLLGSLLVIFLIATPLQTLTNAAIDYADGKDQKLNKFAKINIKTRDEIEDLADSMKKMEKDINQYIVDLLGAEKKADEMKHLADKDALTGINNKRLYFEIEERINEEIKEGKAKFAVTMIDLNDLKVINDTLGHEQGDAAIVVLANVIKEIYKGSETYRIGGDEFVAISEKEELKTVDILEKELRNSSLLKEAEITAAIGIAVFDKNIDNNFEDTFKRADAKMYENKKEMKGKK